MSGMGLLFVMQGTRYLFDFTYAEHLLYRLFVSQLAQQFIPLTISTSNVVVTLTAGKAIQ